MVQVQSFICPYLPRQRVSRVEFCPTDGCPAAPKIMKIIKLYHGIGLFNSQLIQYICIIERFYKPSIIYHSETESLAAPPILGSFLPSFANRKLVPPKGLPQFSICKIHPPFGGAWQAVWASPNRILRLEFMCRWDLYYFNQFSYQLIGCYTNSNR